jgi:ribosomal protein S18 acetylase RimI-like enzyme
MLMLTVQPIQPEEIDSFIEMGNTSGHEAEVKQYLEQMIAIGSIRTEWCYVVKEGSRLLGRVAFWTLPKVGKPLAMVLLDLSWENSDYMSIGQLLLQKTLPAMQALGATEIDYVLDVPVMAPQWQRNPDERMNLLEQSGFRLKRETYRFEWNQQDTAQVELDSSSLVFRTLSEIGEAAFIAAIERVSSAILDRREQQERELYGADDHARRFFRDLQQMEYEPNWWQLAYTSNGELIGLVMPANNPTFATIGYIGVVPEQRGHGYIDVLLRKGMAILNGAGAKIIRADTDLNNFPMANAFRRAGYVEFATRREYSIELGS